ncbi:hypothetical protein KTN05_06205 [Paracoccus sp. Z118]|uniref:hypothetical protein n=1 Tax=Paracoccus sp. Z118 TaxID=2851017 RepID=UPI001C2B922F|nr:hypothetical protein [Paracoccus sp. Z118]MBV0891447.1 hypothetical protein [Paracoccus sp. Z118]
MNDPLTRAWASLIGLSAISAVIAQLLPGFDALALKLASVAILLIGWAKARVILSTYLGLDAVPPIRRGFGVVLGFFMAAALALYLLA